MYLDRNFVLIRRGLSFAKMHTVVLSLTVEAMSKEHEDLLTANRVEIIEDLLVEDVLNYLQSKMVFDNEDSELIQAEKTPGRQTAKLLDMLVTKSDAAFHHFLDSLKEPYPHLVELLQGEVNIPRKISDAGELFEKGKVSSRSIKRSSNRGICIVCSTLFY